MASKPKLKTTDRREEFMNSPKKETKSNVRFDVSKGANASNDSIDYLDNTSSTPLRVSREDVLSSLGYHPGRAQKLMATPTSYQRSDTCHYCGKKVYPLEKMDVGELYHRGCFRCHVCGLQLTLKTFCRVADKGSNKVKEVYCKTHVPKDGFSIDRHTIEINAAINAQKKASEKVMKPYEQTSFSYNPEALEFEHARQIKERQKVKRRRSLKTNADFEKFGVFEAQEELEKQHREEEDELYHQIFEERRQQLKSLEQTLAQEKERTVKELVAWFEQQDSPHKDREAGLSKVEQFYLKQRETKIKELLERMHVEEQAAVARMTEKHAQEMLFLIEQKDKEAGENIENQHASHARRTSEKEMEYRESRIKLRKKNEKYDESLSDEVEDDTENQQILLRKEQEKKIKEIPKEEEQIEQEEEEQDDQEEEEQIEQEEEEQDDQEEEEQIEQEEEEQDDQEEEEQIEQEEEEQDDQEKKEQTELEEEQDDQDEKEQEVREDEHVERKEKQFEQEADQDDQDDQEEEEKVNISEDDMRKVTTGEDDVEEYETDDDENEEWKETVLKPDLKEDLQYEDQNRGISGNSGKNSEFEESLAAAADKDKASSSDTDSEPLVVAKVTPKGVVIEKLKRVPKPKNKEEDEGDKKKLVFSRPSQSDVETQTASEKKTKKQLLPQNSWSSSKDKGGTTSGTPGSRNSVGSKATPGSRNSPGSKTTPGSSSTGSKFQITVSKEKIEHGAEDPKNLRRQKRESKKKTLSSDEDESPRLSTQPEVEPPMCRKSKLYKSAEIFKDFDRHAFEEAQKDPTSFTALIRKLCQNCETDIQKVRAIFRWITAKDLNKIQFSEKQESDTPMGLLRGIKYGTETYHNLFKRICSYAGLHCEIIDGFSKGAGYRPGSKLSGNNFRNQWTAVWLKDSWRFINCNWGARHVKKARDDHPTYKIDEFYFLTDPEDHIYQHFPDSSKWQLLRRPITMEEFVHLPVVKSPFFNSRLTFVSKTESILKASDGYVELKLVSQKPMNFAAKLRSKDGSVPDEVLKNRNLIRKVNDQVIFAANLPAPGRYYWDIFVDPDLSSNSMDNACSFLVHCSSLSSGANQILSFPQVGCFGSTPDAVAFGVRPENETDPRVVATGELAIALHVGKDSTKLSHTLRYWNQHDMSLVDCDRFALMKSRMDKTAVYLIHCPRRGHYVFSLLASDQNAGGSKPAVIYRYFVDSRIAVDKARPMPHASSRWKNCRLIEPLEGELLIQTNVRFRIESKMATEIVVSVNETWYSLQNANGAWQAVIHTGSKVGKLCVYGRFESTKEKYIPLLDYAIKDASLKDEVRALLKYL